ncbi:glutathione S-transferase [Pavlovales sp. CCMP2436]|nr:glutathione S-transferase [Pavlovales sp. CCMP2436]|mmetsp:Transcript_9634/g.24290  ORF Transcript_9634/g.24290 Transcript_9634/m.24290 type:complete len:287 (+) Transcript_9634:99-959(+)
MAGVPCLIGACFVAATSVHVGGLRALRSPPRPLHLSAYRGGEALSSGVRMGGPLASPEPPAIEIEFYTNELCPYAQRVWIALEELGVPYNTIDIDLRDKPRWYMSEISPAGKVPAVRDATSREVLVESRVINEYLTTRFDPDGERMLATGSTLERWNEHVDKVLSPAFFTRLMDKGDSAEGSAEKQGALSDALAYYETNLVGPFLCGEQFTLADVNAIPFFQRLACTLPHFCKVDALSPYPRVRAWLEMTMARPSVATTLPPVDALLKVYEIFVNRDYKFGGLNRN